MRNKIILLSFILIFSLIRVFSQKIYNDPIMLYYLPMNTIVFEIEYEEVNQIKGPYVDFAKAYLGISNAYSKNSTYYRLINVRSKIKTTPDYKRPIIINTNKKEKPNHYITISDNGILLGYNTPEIEFPKEITQEHKVETPILDEESSDYLLLSEDFAKDLPIKTKAKMLADEIYRLREAQQYIISGENEHPLLDKASLEYTINKLNQQEKRITELFTGQTKVKTKIKSIEYTPNKSENKVLFYFNKNMGIIEPEQLLTNSIDNIPVMLSTRTQQPNIKLAENPSTKQKEVSSIYYNVPGYVFYKVFLNDSIFLQKEEQIAQLGVIIPLSINLINDNNTHIYFNANTGNIKSISH